MNPSILAKIWSDPVWSKVVAGLIVALIVWLIPFTRSRVAAAFWALLHPQKPDVEPVVKVTHVIATPPDGSTRIFPLKLYVTFRNDSEVMADVRVLSYKSEVFKQRELAEGVLTVELLQDNFYPRDFAVNRIAVLPKQRFKAWIGLDEVINEASKINSFTGVLGTLTLSINGKTVPFDLRRS
jgi:hypothetical protein